MPKEDIWVHSACDMCLSSCGILVHRLDGVVREIKGDPDCPNSRGKICGRGAAGIMSLYDPNRLHFPLKRTNPEKGIGVDPGWKRLSWEEAMNILVGELGRVRREDPRKLVISSFDETALTQFVGPWGMAFGTPNRTWAGYFCGNYLHSSMYLTNGSFHSDFDADYCNYLVLFGNQAGFGAGLNPNITAQKVAAARKRGMKVVVIDPICNNAGSKADEWVPLRPGTDAALALGMINVLLNELKLYDREFLKRYTNAPYLVNPDGYYIRREGKPQVWDALESRAKPYDAPVQDYALEGRYGVEDMECVPAFQLLKEHAKKYTPERVSEITTIPAATIRRLAQEFGQAARIGSTVEIDGVQIPYRPAAANIYRGAGAHKHGVGAALAIQLLNLTVGNFYVVGGHRGMNLVGPSWSWAPGEFEGLITPPPVVAHGAEYYRFEVKPPESLGIFELFPISTNRSPMCLASSLDPAKYKLPYKPEVMLTCRRNLFMGGVNHQITAQALKNYRFIAAFCTHLDEVAEFADLVLPEAVYLEKLHIFPNNINWGHTAQTGYFYWGIRQPVVPLAGEARDWVDVLLELAERLGFLDELYKHFNLEYKLKEPYRLDPSSKYTKEEIFDRRIKAQFGPDQSLEWFKEHGYISRKRTVDELYPRVRLKARFPIYYENIKIAGEKVKEVTERMGLKEWDVSDYDALPHWKPCSAFGESGEYDLIASNFRVPTHTQSFTSQNAWLSEVAQLNPYAQKILINTETARRKGIKDKDRICVESAVGKVIGEVKVTECIHPEVVGMSSHFGGYALGKPIARGKGVNFNNLLGFGPEQIDWVSSGVDACVKVKVYKVKDIHRADKVK